MGLFSSFFKGVVKGTGRSIKRHAMHAGANMAVGAAIRHSMKPHVHVSTSGRRMSKVDNKDFLNNDIGENEQATPNRQIDTLQTKQKKSSSSKPRRKKAEHVPTQAEELKEYVSPYVKEYKRAYTSSSRSSSRSVSSSSSRSLNRGKSYSYSKSYSSSYPSRSRSRSSSNVSIDSLMKKMKK